ncbi:Atrial natriuretic peptide receptor 1 [Bagarius yarrelli]|uniref:guanylate cyclase n=1 Tax=Bagarius yarrelli TaxID=175774 RepID=A0A556TP12_BAGYA|nr:Atrial natriuretic peptide receptor 1 [Bagarius yarrelli]
MLTLFLDVLRTLELKMECTLVGSLRLPLLVLLSGVSLGVVELEMVPQYKGSPALKNITLAVILPFNNTEYPWALPRVRSALDWAVEKVNSDPTLLPGYRMHLVFSNSENEDGVCSDSVAPLVAVDLKFAYDLWAFIGPGCDYASSPVARFTTHWDVPMVTAGAPAVGFNLYSSITNTGPTHEKLGQFILKMHRDFGWHKYAMFMFHDQKNDDRPCYFAVEGPYTEMKDENMTAEHMVFNENVSVSYTDLINDIIQQARVVYVCCKLQTFRKLMVQFRKQRLPQEEYVFFFIDLFGESVQRSPAKPWVQGDADDQTAKEAFKSVKILTYREPQNAEYKTFVSRLKTEGKKMYNFTIDDSLAELMLPSRCKSAVNTVHSAAGMMSSLSWKRTVDPLGSALLIRLRQLRDSSVTGLLEMDEKGKREIDFALWDMTDTESGVYQIVSVYNSSLKKMIPEPGMKRGSNYGSLLTMEGNVQIYAKTCYYKYINKKRIELTRTLLFELKHMRDVQNEHLTRFIGACIDLPNTCILTEYCPRGSLQGMSFLHNSVIGCHGNLKSSNCVVDSRFVLKITDYGLVSFRNESSSEDLHAYYAQIVERVSDGRWPYLRPLLCTQSHSEELGQLMQRCWAEEPSDRPDFNQIKVMLRKHNRGYGSNILDNLLSRMEQYANNLEELVEERTQAYHEEKRKAEALLYQILPHSVAEQLKRGETVQAEAFDSVTIYFSDIVGFTALSAESTPMQVVTLLNDLYTCFDAIIDNFDVYKVETIGDAYMVVSGLPVRNGKLHAREIANMSLALLKAVHTFRIRHRPDLQLRLRIGIHTGPVCAGVVGLKMPRYCLFGDTVNTASRMESNGEALKIHVSEATRLVLQEFNCFQLELRGDVEMKGKGRMRTYWLLGRA